MPRKELLPAREVEICKRFESFRRGSKLSRREFASCIGFSPERVALYESARAPIRYEFFREVHRLYSISPRWLTTGDGSPLAGGRFDDLPFRDSFRDSELLSAVYDRVLAPHFNTVEMDVAEYLFAPDGVEEKVAKILDDLADPKRKELYSRDLKERIASFLQDAWHRYLVIVGEPPEIEQCLLPKAVRRHHWQGLPGWPEPPPKKARQTRKKTAGE